MNRSVVVIGSGSHHNTLGVIRALKGCPLDVIALLVGGGFVSQSRYVKRSFLFNNYSEIPSFLINQNHNSDVKDIIISCADEATEVLNLHWNKLSVYYIVPSVPLQGSMVNLMNKLTMKKIGEEVGFIFPEVFDALNAINEVRYPCITKANISSHGGKADITICHNREELECYLENVTDDVFVQKYITKKEEVQFIGCSLNCGEEIVIPGMTRIMRSQNNTNTGFLHYGAIDPFYEKIVENCKKFLRKCQYSGLFSMEFLRDVEDTVYFLEINFRNDGNAWCVTASGINLPMIWVKAHSNQDYSEEIKSPKDIIVMPEFQDFKLVIQHKLGFWHWLRDVRRTDTFLLWNKKDQKPFWFFIKSKVFGR